MLAIVFRRISARLSDHVLLDACMDNLSLSAMTTHVSQPVHIKSLENPLQYPSDSTLTNIPWLTQSDVHQLPALSRVFFARLQPVASVSHS